MVGSNTVDYTIRQIDVNNPLIGAALENLYNKSFGKAVSIEKIIANTSSNAKLPTLYIAAVNGEKVLGCVIFISNDFILNERSITCYQAAWGATDSEYAGKNIFISIIEYAKKELSIKGCGFIFGVPNNNSKPILINKLGFREDNMLQIKLFNLPGLRYKNLIYKNIRINNANTCQIIEQQVIGRKENEYKVIRVNAENGSFLWGKIEYKNKMGIRIPYFYVGGIQLSRASDLKQLISLTFKKNKIAYIQIVINYSHTYVSLIKNWSIASMNGFIVYDLQGISYNHLNLFYGAIDVF